MIKSLYPKFQEWSKTGSIYLLGDTHFDDADCKLMDPNWISAQEQIQILKTRIHKTDTFVLLGDVGNGEYLKELSCKKILITGNHDVLSKVGNYFDEIYTGPLFIADRILLSHEPIYGLENFCINIHGHVHDGMPYAYSYNLESITHYNLAANICNYRPMNLGKLIEAGMLSNTPNYHRLTIDKASERE
jgi:calcineurin-like phosphoesterase family protein